LSIAKIITFLPNFTVFIDKNPLKKADFRFIILLYSFRLNTQDIHLVHHMRTDTIKETICF